jgi:hypothetical protein
MDGNRDTAMSDSKTLFATLKVIFSLWPKNKEACSISEETLRLYLDKDFDLGDLCNYPISQFSIFSTDAWLKGNIAQVLVYDPKDPDYPNLATLVRTDDGTWKLKSFQFLCLSCFGTGVHLGEPCGVCGLTGWGLNTGTLLTNSEQTELNTS